MLTEIAPRVWTRQSGFCLSNAVFADGLLVDPGVSTDDLDELARDLSALDVPVAAGFATHPHWDHVLWRPDLGDVPRYATPSCVRTCAAHLDDARTEAARHGAPVDLLGILEPWPGRDGVEVIEHRAHAPGHAALLVRGVLIAGDMLSDVEVPLLDTDADDPCADYLAALDGYEGVLGGVEVVVPGHGSVARGAEIRRRLDADRAYVTTLVRGVVPDDPRVGPDATYGRDWLPAQHRAQAAHVTSSRANG